MTTAQVVVPHFLTAFSSVNEAPAREAATGVPSSAHHPKLSGR